jgi:hypothetical protein
MLGMRKLRAPTSTMIIIFAISIFIYLWRIVSQTSPVLPLAKVADQRGDNRKGVRALTSPLVLIVI